MQVGSGDYSKNNNNLFVFTNNKDKVLMGQPKLTLRAMTTRNGADTGHAAIGRIMHGHRRNE